MNRCDQCKKLIVDQTWLLTVKYKNEEPNPKSFCSHLCTFEWLQQNFETQMTSMKFMRSGKRKPENCIPHGPFENGVCERCGGMENPRES